MKKLGLILLALFSVNCFASSLDTPWSEATKIVSIAGYSEGSVDDVVITFQSGSPKLNPVNCSKTDMYILHIADKGNNIGGHLMSMALTAGAANLNVKFKVHHTTCRSNRPVVSDLQILFN